MGRGLGREASGRAGSQDRSGGATLATAHHPRPGEEILAELGDAGEMVAGAARQLLSAILPNHQESWPRKSSLCAINRSIYGGDMPTRKNIQKLTRQARSLTSSGIGSC